MTRLASRSPAAPFSTSRPAPMPQYPPQATKTTEAQTLRQMVQEREEKIRDLERKNEQMRQENDRFREALDRILDGFTHTGGSPQDIARKALYGGGDDS